MSRRALVLLSIALAVALSGCAAEKVDPLAVVNSATITDIEDNTGSDYYDVTSARIVETRIATTLTLGFDIYHANATAFSPVSTVTFADGTVLTCEAGDPRRVPALQETTTEWDFECDGDLPEDADGATVSIIDAYH